MKDNFNRYVNYLRISLTDRCNLECTYCVPDEGRKMLSKRSLLTTTEIIDTIRVVSDLGINKIRFTGGEPLLRKDIFELIRITSSIKSIDDISITTNGILLKDYAERLANSGLKRINISLDTINPEKFRRITRVGRISDVFEGIYAAIKYNLNPVKINCVINESKNESDAREVEEFCNQMGLSVRFIKRMNLANGIFSEVDGGEGGKCGNCNRMRLTAEGNFKPCLFNNSVFNIREFGIKDAFKKAIDNKPEYGTKDTVNEFYSIGG